MADQVLFGGFRRLGKFALDPTSVAPTLQALNEYIAKDPTAYDGQQVIVTNDPNEKNNGTYSIIFKTEVREDGSSYNVLVPKQSANMEQVKEIVDNTVIEINDTITEISTGIEANITELSTVLNNDISTIKTVIGIDESGEETGENLLSKLENIVEDIQIINSFVGITDDENTEAGENINSKISDLLVRITELEELLQGDGDDIDAIATLKTSLENLSSLVIGSYATKVELKEVKDLIDKIDDNAINDSFEAFFGKLNVLEEKLKASETKLDNHLKNIQTSFDIYLLDSFAKGQFKPLVVQTMIPTTNRLDEKDAELSDQISTVKTDLSDYKSVIDGSILTINSNIEKKVDQSVYTEFVEKTEKDIIDKTKNSQKIARLDFYDGSEKYWIDLPSGDVVVTAARLVVSNPSSNADVYGDIYIENAGSFCDGSKIYYDYGAEYILEKTFVLRNDVNKVFICARDPNSNACLVDVFGRHTFSEASGYLFITYYEN